MKIAVNQEVFIRLLCHKFQFHIKSISENCVILSYPIQNFNRKGILISNKNKLQDALTALEINTKLKENIETQELRLMIPYIKSLDTKHDISIDNRIKLLESKIKNKDMEIKDLMSDLNSMYYKFGIGVILLFVVLILK